MFKVDKSDAINDQAKNKIYSTAEKATAPRGAAVL
jgi:hypothetical protein